MDDDRLWRWVTFSPALILMLALSVLPIVNLFWMSFYNVTWAGGQATWTPVGLAHYGALFRDRLFAGRTSQHNHVCRRCRHRPDGVGVLRRSAV